MKKQVVAIWPEFQLYVLSWPVSQLVNQDTAQRGLTLPNKTKRTERRTEVGWLGKEERKGEHGQAGWGLRDGEWSGWVDEWIASEDRMREEWGREEDKGIEQWGKKRKERRVWRARLGLQGHDEWRGWKRHRCSCRDGCSIAPFALKGSQRRKSLCELRGLDASVCVCAWKVYLPCHWSSQANH